MQQETIDGLVRLRDAILRDLGPLVAGSNLPIPEQFDIYLRLARASGGVEYYEKAYGLLGQADEDSKVGLYLGLLGDVDFEINNAATEPAAVTSADNQQA